MSWMQRIIVSMRKLQVHLDRDDAQLIALALRTIRYDDIPEGQFSHVIELCAWMEYRIAKFWPQRSLAGQVEDVDIGEWVAATQRKAEKWDKP